MGYNQYVNIRLRAENLKIGIKTAKITSGKFYKTDKKDDEISSSDIELITIESGSSNMINACGRYAARKGTEGYLEIMDIENERILGKYSWDCPFWSSENTSKWENHKDDKDHKDEKDHKNYKDSDLKDCYTIKLYGGKKKGGPIGEVTLIIIKN